MTGGAYAAPTGYDSNGAPSVDDLASALRGMAVADEHGGAPSAMPQPRTAVSYSPYYSGQAGQGDFAYGYADASSFTPAGMATGASTVCLSLSLLTCTNVSGFSRVFSMTTVHLHVPQPRRIIIHPSP